MTPSSALSGTFSPRGEGKINHLNGTAVAHWMIENNLHWTLDVVFNEDQSRVRKDHAGENMAIVRHIVINMLNKAKGPLTV